MIIRSLRLRHGRLALPKPPTPICSWRRYLASEAERTENPFNDQQNVDSTSSKTLQSLPTRSYSGDEIRDPNHPVAQDWAFFHHQKARTSEIGSVIGPHYRPHELLSNPPYPKDITLELLMASQAHIGHATSLWHPANAKYIFGIRGDHDPIHVISLDVTAAYLRRACKIVRGVTSRGGVVLFVGTREGQARTVVKAAEMAKGCHLFTRWIAGSITNGQQILGACRKKVVDELDEEVLGFDDQLATKAVIKPDLVVCLNPLENYILLHECGLHNIPTIGIVDTDANPTWVTYPIPANDDSLRCVQVIAGVLGRAGQEGQEARLVKAQRGDIAYLSPHGLVPPTEGQAEKERNAAERELLEEEERTVEEMGEIVEGEWMVGNAEVAGQEVDDSQVVAQEDGFVDDPIDVEANLARYGSADDEADVDAMEVDSSLRREQVEDAERDFQEYTRDRPLSGEELQQGYETQPASGDIEVAKGPETAELDSSSGPEQKRGVDVDFQGYDRERQPEEEDLERGFEQMQQQPDGEESETEKVKKNR